MMLSTHFSLEELILNQMIGGAKNSMHTLGLAADILSPAIGPPLQVCRAIARSGILIDQVNEFGRWCHGGFAPEGHSARNELLTRQCRHGL